MSSVITNPISNIPINAKSHVHGWTQTWHEQLGSDINYKCTPKVTEYDTVYIDHGANFGGTLNLFGGADKSVYDKVNIIASCKNVISLDHDMPQWGEQFRKRIGAASTYEGITEEWCDALTARFANTQSLKQEDLQMDGITLGDSHTIAFARSNDCVLRNDGKTLHGALRQGIRTMFRDKPIKGNITLCFGSIDIRHHLLRHKDLNLESMIREYVNQGQSLEFTDNCDVYYATPVPVEFEGRRIPKSGFYKKEPFFGSWQERYDLTNRFIDELYKQSGGKVVQPPKEWYTMDPEKYAKEFMEHGSSFHIAPPFYRRNDWGVTALGA